VARPTQRPALGALFLVLAVFFGGVAFAAAGAALDSAGLWIVVVAAAAVGLWLLGLALRALGRR
jgi:hypothetical protein